MSRIDAHHSARQAAEDQAAAQLDELLAGMRPELLDELLAGQAPASLLDALLAELAPADAVLAELLATNRSAAEVDRTAIARR